MPRITCNNNCFFSEELRLFNKGETYNVSNPTWTKMQKIGMDKYFSAAPTSEKPVASTAPESQGK